MVKYQKYKEINLPWLKIVPANWDIKRNKQFLHERKKIVGNKSSEYTLLSLTLRGIVVRDLSENKGKIPASLDNYKIVEPGDIAFCLFDIDETPRTVGLSKYKGMLTGAYNIFHIEGINARYLYYYYLALDNIKGLRPLYTGLRKTINVNTFLSQQMPVPPCAEQDQIVRFLDWKVSEINKLIGIRKKEIQELEELRRLTIINSVSNNREIESSDWKTAKVKSICRMQSGTNLVSQVIDNKGKYPVYGGNGLRGYYKEYTNNGQYVLIGRQGALAGNVHLVDGKFWATDHAVVVYCSDYLDYKYAYYMFTGMNLNQYAFDTAAQPGLSVTKVLNLKCSFPSLKKQLEIVRRLDELCLRYDNAIRIAKSKIQLLQELKSVIISDVVTGKIDVRNVTIPEYEHVDDISDDDNEDGEVTEETETDGEEA